MDKNEEMLKGRLCLSIYKLLLNQWALRKWEFPPRISCWEKERAPVKGEFVYWRFQTVPTACQIMLQGQPEAQTILGQWWVEPHLDQDCEDMHIQPLLSI